MKGVILAGGLGKRLYPLTKISNKHLLPVYSKPMIYYPIEILVEAGIKDILIVTGGNHAGEFLRLLGNGQQFGLRHLNYTYQEGEGGIAAALELAKHFSKGEKIVVVLGDNIIEKDIKAAVKNFDSQPKGARILIQEVKDPKRFGVVEFKKGKMVSIKEKPRKPKSNFIVTGIYMYDHTVFDIVKTLKPSKRGELEITDVNTAYLKKGQLEYDILKGWWSDSGTFDSLLKANNLVAGKEETRNQKRRNQKRSNQS